MTNDYLEIELTPNKYGGGSFSCSAQFKLDSFNTLFQDVEVKIDTGCSVSTIPLKKLGIPDAMCRKLKSIDIDNHTGYIRSYGVETGGQSHTEPQTKRSRMKCEALKFRHYMEDFRLNNVIVPAQTIYLNYNRTGNILIGMDILQSMVTHWDISRKTGKLILLSCPRDSLNKEFCRAMEEHFGLSTI